MSTRSRRRATARRAVGIIGILAIGGLLAGGPARAAGSPVLVDCAGKGVAKPSTITISCADAGVAITKITWSSWKQSAAQGKGTLTVNTCEPTCAAGNIESFPVRISLGGLASAPGKPDVFSAINLTFAKGGPAMLNAGTYIIDNPMS